jgi:hypothetical protein
MDKLTQRRPQHPKQRARNEKQRASYAENNAGTIWAKKAKEEAAKAAVASTLQERRLNPKTPLEAYLNHIENCPWPPYSAEAQAWRQENRVFKFNVGYCESEWSPELSQSGKTWRWTGRIYGEDGSIIPLEEVRIRNRRRGFAHK